MYNNPVHIQAPNETFSGMQHSNASRELHYVEWWTPGSLTASLENTAVHHRSLAKSYNKTAEQGGSRQAGFSSVSAILPYSRLTKQLLLQHMQENALHSRAELQPAVPNLIQGVKASQLETAQPFQDKVQICTYMWREKHIDSGQQFPQFFHYSRYYMYEKKDDLSLQNSNLYVLCFSGVLQKD